METFKQSQEQLTIKPQITLKQKDDMTDSAFNFASEIGNTVSSVVRLSVSFSGIEATNISIILKSPEAVRLNKSHFNIEKLRGNSTPAVIETEFTVDNRIPLTELALEVSGCFEYQGPANLQTGIVYVKVPLSLESYCYLVSPVKEADFKLTLEANCEIPALSSVFEAFIEATKPQKEYYENPNVLSFLLNDGSISTLIVAKNSSRSSVIPSQTTSPGEQLRHSLHHHERAGHPYEETSTDIQANVQ